MDRLEARQLWNPGLSTSTIPCPPVTLVAGGSLVLPSNNAQPITQAIVYYSNLSCYPPDPFYASTIVFVYVLGTCTVMAWILFVLLLIAQRTFHPARAATLSSGWIAGRRGLTTAIAGRTPLGGLGARPWLQKVAVFLVSAGLTVASVDAFREAARQQSTGVMDATQMRHNVSDTQEIRIMRIISGVFIWLAQVQTLIRLFPRRKEKLIIKWLGFTLILCDLVFSGLDSFLGYAQYSRNSPRYYQDAIPALSYLFQLAISLLYLAWVLYYVITQRRYAFFRPDQLNMSIVALLALVSIAIPVGFFVADVSVPVVAGWGDLFRWVGSTAASIVVWEWVDRIEATEREEKRDGILGREVFDEDEQQFSDSRPRGSSYSGSDGSRRKPKSSSPRISMLKRISKGVKEKDTEGHVPFSERTRAMRWKSKQRESTNATLGIIQEPGEPIGQNTSPSRTDTASADSTVYAVHYHPITITPPLPVSFADAAGESRDMDRETGTGEAFANPMKRRDSDVLRTRAARRAPPKPSGWSLAAQAFKKRKKSPPVEIKQALSLNEIVVPSAETKPSTTKFDFRNRLAALRPGIDSLSSGSHLERLAPQPTVIPPPPRGQTYSPDISRHSPVNPLHRGTNTTLQIHPALQRHQQVIGEEGEENDAVDADADASDRVSVDQDATAVNDDEHSSSASEPNVEETQRSDGRSTGG